MGGLRKFADRLLRPTFEGDVDKTGMARLLNTFMLASVAAILLYFVVTAITDGFPEGDTLTMLGAYIAVAVLAVFGLHSGYVRAVGVLVVLMIWGLSSSFVLRYGGIKDEFLPAYFVSLAAAGLILGGRGLLVFGLMTAGTLGVAYYLEAIGYLTPPNPYPSGEDDLVVVLLLMGLLAYFVNYAATRIKDATEAYHENSVQLSAANRALEVRQAQHTAERARLLGRLQASVAVTQATTAAMDDTDRLLSSVAEAVAHEFGFYHVAVFWVNPGEGNVVVRAASSVEGEEMLARGHRLRIGQGIVGTAAASGESRLVSDVADDPDFAFNPALARTRCELAVPVTLGDEVVAVLDLQSSQSGAFTTEDVVVLESLARQISLAIGKARLVDGLQRDLAAAEQTYRGVAREDWSRLLQAERGIGFISTPQGTALLDAVQMDGAQLGGSAMAQSETLRIPVRLAGQTVAEIEAHLPPDRGAWTQDQVDLAGTLSDQLSQALERARLHRETQRRAVRERILREITDEMGSASDLQSLLRITAESLSRSLGSSQLYVKLASQDSATSGTETVSDVVEGTRG